MNIENKMYRLLAFAFTAASLTLLYIAATADPLKFRASSEVVYGCGAFAVLIVGAAAGFCWQRATQ